ncbi:hypothetical protein HU200_008735 [Digitaria exilis]|uniref:Reverse transcriptase zinc-binding domain-containing protein n=1 Tax=Digitaria exilis TaxID=1010633 RepID=A0A835FL79_9POAL|nr:hypothetical protein HU200_008735 [Digitaria exilis]
MWKSCCRGRHKFFFWLLLRDRLNTRNILRRKRRALEDYHCAFCSANTEETLFHLFFECSFSQWCWRFLNVRWNFNLMDMDMLIQARRDFNSKIFREVVIIATWAIWTHRNEKQLFRDEFSHLLHRAKPTLKLELQTWLSSFH